MFAGLKKIFSLLFKNKAYLFLILSLTAFFFILRFPLNEWLEKSIKDLQKESPLTREISFNDLKAKWLPPGLLFQDVSFVYKGKTSRLDSALVSISLKDWIAFKKGFNVQLRHGRSKLFFNFKTKPVPAEEELAAEPGREIYLLRGSSSLIDLKDLSFLYPNMSGDLKIQFFYQGSFQDVVGQDVVGMTGELNLTGENISFSELKLNTLLGPLNLPSIKWTNSETELEVKEGELIFKTVELGGEKDDLKVKMGGSGAFSSVRRAVRLSSYNIELQIDIDKKIPFGFLDLMFASYKEDKGDFYRYSVRMIGQGSQVPKMEKLESF